MKIGVERPFSQALHIDFSKIVASPLGQSHHFIDVFLSVHLSNLHFDVVDAFDFVMNVGVETDALAFVESLQWFFFFEVGDAPDVPRKDAV